MRIPSLLLSLLLFAAGCGGPKGATSGDGAAQTNGAAESESSEVASLAVPGEPVNDVDVQVKSWDEAKRHIATHQGKVVVADLWSTWCVPCVREFPNLVALHKTFGDQVACVSVNLDYTGAEDESPEENVEKVKRFLVQQRATFDNILSSTPIDDVLNSLEAGSIPVVLVYNQQGELAKVFQHDEDLYGTEGFSYEGHIIPLVKELIQTSAPSE